MSASESVGVAHAVSDPRQQLLPDLLHLWVLNAFAVAQPLLSQLSGNAPYIVEQRLSGIAVIWIAVALLCGLPLLLCLLEISVAFVRPAARGRLHTTLVGVFCALLGMLTARSFVRGYNLEMSGFIDVVQLAVAAAIFVTLYWLYNRTRIGRGMFTIAATGLVIFPLSFAFTPAIQPFWRPAPEDSGAIAIQQPVPLVMVVFDGLALNSLLDSEQEIDAVRYPNFARLAKQADWFRNATTVHPRTDHAIPAILSGKYPVDGTSPVLDLYPHNLFDEFHRSGQYEFFVLEPYTRLCPPELQHQQSLRPLRQQVTDTLSTLGRVYLKIAFLKNVSANMPSIPMAWFSLPPTFVIDPEDTSGLFRYAWDIEREVQASHFLNGLIPGEQPRLMFAHLAVPHYPFRYLPSGRAYTGEQSAAMFPDGTHGEVGELWGPDELACNQSWQRYLLQIGYVDRVLGKILDRLTETGLLDECLLVVTADHGCSFRVGHSQREPEAASLPDILPIPLFIKRPHQQTGSVSDRNVETIDVLPTIADVLKIDWPGELDGESVYATTPARQRKTVVMRHPLVLNGIVPMRSAALERRIQQFGEGPRDARFWSLGLHPELVGRNIQDFEIDTSGKRSIGLEVLSRADGRDTVVPIVPSLFRGELDLAPEETEPVLLAISIDDQIVGVTRTFTDPDYLNRWALLIPEEVLDAHPEPPKIWELRYDGDQPKLLTCRQWGLNYIPASRE
ncbi:sulfatase-like hydrolase/transferase [bacterium]|nr:sulfatase-like hydrolase/transferase [bacterium]